MNHPLCIATDSPPVPAGWYTVCASDALPAGGMQPFRLAGLTLLAWRNKNGTPCVTDRRCPHLGGDLAAGHVSDAGLVCPIHRFAFAADGGCRATGFDSVSGKAHIQPWPLLEQDGLLLVYYHPDGHAPHWQPPAHDWQGWTAQRIDSCELPATVQLITEGIADKGHLATVHGYSDVSLTAAFCCDGPTLATAYRFVNSG
ncbi:MAG TPA: Rieske 2Fe-2S domain-containing protein, partial [Pseudomonadales bacterium]